MSHHAIIVTSCNDALLHEAYLKAIEIFKFQVSGVVESLANGYYSFFIAPDGGADGWVTSEEGDENRDKYISLLSSGQYAALKWIEIKYGNNDTAIVRDSHEKARANKQAAIDAIAKAERETK